MRSLLALLAIVTGFWISQAQAKSSTWYVAPHGNDRWTGKAAQPSRDGKDGPLATLPAALKAARAARQANQTAVGVTIFLRGGTYELAEPLVLTPEDSGVDAQHPLTIAAYRNEQPVLSGGRRITGWKSVTGKPRLWRTEVPAVREGKWYFRQLFVNGERKQRARTPNEGFFRIQGESPQDKPVKLKFKPGDLRKEWADGGDVEVVALLGWADFRMQIRTVDEAAQIATLSGDPRPSNQEKDARYFVENTPDGLDAPGEWYLDRKTGVVTYWPLADERMEKAEVIAPQLEELLRLQGDFAAKKPVQHVVLRGLTFSYADWPLGPTGYADTQAAVGVRGDVVAEGAVDCAVEECRFTHLAGYALEFGRGCQRNRIVGNEMFDLGAGGIRVGEPAARDDAFEQTHHLTITDNHLHQLGRVYPSAIGVFLLQSGQNRVAHNHIHDLFYTAISVGWNWGYQETPCRENIIEFNHLHDIGQFMLSDLGGVYTLGIQKGTVVRNNLIHDANSFTYGGWGLYMDEGSTGILMENNVAYRCKSAGFCQHYGRDNVVRNNLFAFGKEYQLWRGKADPHISFILTNNLVYFDSGELLVGSWKNDNYTLDHNLYFDARPGATPETMKFAGATFAQWRLRGHDVHSRITDPLFRAPQKYDFRLKKNSPARQLGFKPIDLKQVGVRKKSQRAEDQTEIK